MEKEAILDQAQQQYSRCPLKDVPSLTLIQESYSYKYEILRHTGRTEKAIACLKDNLIPLIKEEKEIQPLSEYPELRSSLDIQLMNWLSEVASCYLQLNDYESAQTALDEAEIILLALRKDNSVPRREMNKL